MNFVTLFPETENVHLIKDVGMIGYVMHKYYGYNSSIACYKNGEYKYLEDEVKGLKLHFIKKRIGATLDGCVYIIRAARKIDVLHLFHLRGRSFLWMLIYKALCPKGKVFLKIDGGLALHKKLSQKHSTIKVWVIRWTTGKNCLISTETKSIQSLLRKDWTADVKYIPNGFYDNGKKHPIQFKNKDNVLCTVGRIGTQQKATEILLEAFKIASEDIKDWNLRIVGAIEKQFEPYISKYFEENPNLRARVIFTGVISDRKILDAEYEKAKIFCLPSRFESFGIVLTEALKNGCYMICTNLPTSIEITGSGKYAKYFEIDDTKALAQLIIETCKNENGLLSDRLCEDIQEYAYNNYYLPKICKEIDSYLMASYRE